MLDAVAAGSEPRDSKKLSWSAGRGSFWVLLGASLLGVVPVWISAYPPMADLPQHAAQVALMRGLHNPSFAYGSLFRLNWFTPYLLGYSLIYVLAFVFGILTACKIVISLFVVGFPLAAGLLLGSVAMDEFWAILCIPGVYGFAYQWGFLNFLITLPLGLLFLWFVLRHCEAWDWRGALVLAGSALALFFCHALICAFFCGCAAICLLATARTLETAAKRMLPLAAVLPVALLWMRRTVSDPDTHKAMIWDLSWRYTVEPYYASLTEEPHNFAAGWGRATGLFPRLLGLSPSWQHALLGIALFLLPLCAGMRLHHRLTLWSPFLLCVAVLLFCPHAVFGTDYVYQRFTIFLVPFYLLLLRRSDLPRGRDIVVRCAALALVAVLIGLAARRASVFSRETAGFQDALSHMQPGQRVLSLAFDHEDGVSIAPTFLHFPEWYAAQKQGMVDPSAAMMFPELVVYRKGDAPKAVLWDFEWSPEEFDWDDFSGWQYRYFVVRSPEDLSPKLFAQATCVVRQISHQGEWRLYENAAGCAPAGRAVTAPSR